MASVVADDVMNIVDDDTVDIMEKNNCKVKKR
jgi:hypothetical protein